MLVARLHEQEIRAIVNAPGVGNRSVEGVAPFDRAVDNSLTFVSKVPARFLHAFGGTHKGCIVLKRPGAFPTTDWGDCLVLEVADPRLSIADILAFVVKEERISPMVTNHTIARSARISPLAVVERNVEIGEDVVIEPFSIIGPDVVIGRATTVRSGARLYPRTTIGSECTIGANAQIGTEGWGFVQRVGGFRTRIPHLGGVVIGDYVEIGAAAIVQSGTISPTMIDEHVKIGELSGIGHNAHVRRAAHLLPRSTTAGSVVIGAEALIGLRSTVRDGRVVGDRAVVGMNVSVQQDLEADGVHTQPMPRRRPRGTAVDPTKEV